MMRLNPGRRVVAAIFVALWAVPLSVEWYHQPPTWFGQWLPAAFDDPPAAASLAFLRSVALILAPILFFLIAPAKPTGAKPALILVDRRILAGLIDLIIVITALGNPLWVALIGLNQLQFGNTPDWSLLAVPTGWVGGLTVLPAWLAYTYWHLATRTQSLGQYVAGYRLVFATPLTSYREPAVQLAYVLLWASRSIIKYHWWKSEFDHPGWYRQAGVHTVDLHYD